MEGDHRGARGRHRRHLRLLRRDAHRADRRDRERRRPGEHRLRGADEGGAGVVREAVRPVGQPRQHPAGGSRSRSRRCGSASAATRSRRCCSVTAGAFTLPDEQAVEAMSAEEILALCLREFPGQVALACSFQKEESVLLDMLFAIEPKARVFAIDTHYLFPETYELWREVEQRYDTKVEVFEGPSPRTSPRSTATSSGSASPTSTSRSRRSSRSSGRWATSTPGSPASAATSRRRARTRRSSAGTRRTSCGRRTRSPTGATTTAGPTSASAGCPTTRCTTAATTRSATRTRRCPGAGREGRWAGTDRTECGLHVEEVA